MRPGRPTPGNTSAVRTAGRAWPWTKSGEWFSSPPVRLRLIFGAAIASAKTCMPTVCWPLTPPPAGACGIFNSCIMICGTATCPRRPISSPSDATEKRSTPWRRSPSPATYSCSIAKRGNLCFPSRNDPCRRRICRASRCGRPSLCRGNPRHSPANCSRLI